MFVFMSAYLLHRSPCLSVYPSTCLFLCLLFSPEAPPSCTERLSGHLCPSRLYTGKPRFQSRCILLSRQFPHPRPLFAPAMSSLRLQRPSFSSQRIAASEPGSLKGDPTMAWSTIGDMGNRPAPFISSGSDMAAAILAAGPANPGLSLASLGICKNCCD